MLAISNILTTPVFKSTYSSRLLSGIRNYYGSKLTGRVRYPDGFQLLLVWALRLLTLVGLYVMMYSIALAEFHSDYRPANQTFSMVDIGFKVTHRLHAYLQNHSIVHHWLAFLNTLGVDVVLVYTVLVIGYWQRRPGIVLVETVMFLARLACGWLTQLPYSDEYLASEHDFPDCLTNKLRDSADQRPHASFFFFFSGHVAVVSLVAAHFRRSGRRWPALLCHAFNALQTVRLLATRGHYTIDLIGGALVGSYAYSFVDSADRALTECKFCKYLVRVENVKAD